MSIKIKKQRITDTINKPRKSGYFPRVLKNGQKTLKEVLKSSVHGSTYDYREAKGAFEMAFDGIAEALADGYNVDLGPLGSFVLTAHSEMIEDADDLKRNKIKITIKYKISEELQEVLNEAEIEFVE
jgi:nucleoid DNA-binding protein